jgi:hypothetical protein
MLQIKFFFTGAADTAIEREGVKSSLSLLFSSFYYLIGKMSIFSFCLNSICNNYQGKSTINHQPINDFSAKYATNNDSTIISFTPLQDNHALNVLLSGQTNASTMNMRGELLKNNPVKVK